jgi:hypothetical protein
VDHLASSNVESDMVGRLAIFAKEEKIPWLWCGSDEPAGLPLWATITRNGDAIGVIDAIDKSRAVEA